MKSETIKIRYKCIECGETHTTDKEYTKLPYGLDDITIGHSSESIENPFSGVKYELDAIEEAVYSVIKGAEWMIYQGDDSLANPRPKEFNAKKLHRMMMGGLDWFRTNNSEAYMALLD